MLAALKFSKMPQDMKGFVITEFKGVPVKKDTLFEEEKFPAKLLFKLGHFP